MWLRLHYKSIKNFVETGQTTKRENKDLEIVHDIEFQLCRR